MDHSLPLQRPEVSEYDLLNKFQQQSHSLRVSASNIAAIAGFHPWKNLPEFFLIDCVYQGGRGRQLLRRDTQLLDIELVNEETILRNLAAKAGVSVTVNEALKIKRGESSVTDIQGAKSIKKSVVEAAKKANILSKTELQLLSEGVRTAVDTGYGTFHEDAALNIYEAKTGETVFARNAEIRMQEYVTSGDDTVQPRSKPRPCTSLQITRPAKNLKEGDDGKEEPPFFSIVGSVDGMRQELLDIGDGDDGNWTFQNIIVECKHRMKRLKTIPPLYEQIQTVAYCHLYGVNHADIVQVLRDAQKPRRERRIENDKSSSSAGPEPSRRDDQNLDTKVILPDKTDSENDPAPRPDKAACEASLMTEPGKATEKPKNEETTKRQDPNITISISRVSLDDPVMQHRQQWNTTILPRLRLFVDAVYRVRSDDDKRYQLLAAVSEQSNKAWKLLFQECPWLEHCDTAFANSHTVD